MGAHARIEIQIHAQHACIVTLRGEHDASSSEAVTLALTAARDYGTILVDLGECTFVDSSLINALLVAAQRARELGGSLELVLPVEAITVRRTLEIANVQILLPFHGTREAGIAAIATPAPARSRPEPTRAETRRAATVRAGSLILRARVVPDGVSMSESPGWKGGEVSRATAHEMAHTVVSRPTSQGAAMSDEPHDEAHTHADGTTHAHPHEHPEHRHLEHEHQHTHPDGTTHAHPHTHEEGGEANHAHTHDA